MAGHLTRRTMEPLAPLPSLRAVVLDWSGTTVDHGSLAPLLAIMRTFAEAGVPLTREARSTGSTCCSRSARTAACVAAMLGG